LEHKAYWAIEEMNLDLDAAVVKQWIQISELEETKLPLFSNHVQSDNEDVIGAL
jgi:hypothetical protein